MSRLKVLFVCAMNKKRSLTAEQIYAQDPRLAVRSVGTRTQARRRIGEADLRWAEVVFVMEHRHRQWIRERFRDRGLNRPLPPVDVLEIPDDYEFMQPALIELLRRLLDPELERLLAERSEGADEHGGAGPAEI